MGRQPSLRTQLYLWTLVPMALVLAASGWMAYENALETANAVVDRMLLGAARVIGESIGAGDGRLHAELPPAALENLQNDQADFVYYRVDAPAEGLLLGAADLPLAPVRLPADDWRGLDLRYRGETVRAVVFAQPIYPFTAGSAAWIQVAITRQGLLAFARHLWLRAVAPQALLLLVAASLGWLWVRRALAPVSRISDRLRLREPQSTTPLAFDGVPQELSPIVEAFNQHMARIGSYVAERGRFIANAAHQLKTPVTVLNTQLAVGLQADTPEGQKDALNAAYAAVQHCRRLIHQLLTLSLAESDIAAMPTEEVALGPLLEAVVVGFAEMAHEAGVDLGLRLPSCELDVRANPLLLEELVGNLVDNAIRYAGRGAVVTLALVHGPHGWSIDVEDDGPGIAPQEREKVFERFYRGSASNPLPGTGLGLSIAREIALASNMELALLDRADPPRGLVARVVFHALPPGFA